mmetsp:Transcript_25372/g.59888  ORF Transcript_25372/g.59888 Transcript_25372/m.59888 type:complete len:234 (+) Transcript_25372:512-1213(+)
MRTTWPATTVCCKGHGGEGLGGGREDIFFKDSGMFHPHRRLAIPLPLALHCLCLFPLLSCWGGHTRLGFGALSRSGRRSFGGGRRSGVDGGGRSFDDGFDDGCRSGFQGGTGLSGSNSGSICSSFGFSLVSGSGLGSDGKILCLSLGSGSSGSSVCLACGGRVSFGSSSGNDLCCFNCFVSIHSSNGGLGVGNFSSSSSSFIDCVGLGGSSLSFSQGQSRWAKCRRTPGCGEG